MIDPGEVADRVRAVRARIDAAADGRSVRLIAVTKGFGPDAVRAALGAGITDIGESYAQEMTAKFEEFGTLPLDVNIHFIGRLQTNKVKMLSGRVDVFQSVDRQSLVQEIARRSPGAALLIQLDLSGETTKGGCPFEAAPGLVGYARDLGLDVRGFMGIGPTGPAELARRGFAKLVALADDMGLPERSIGMSGDLEIAVEEGSTMVRIGRDLFGPRQHARS